MNGIRSIKRKGFSSIEELKSTAEECGFAEINVFADLASEQPREKSERIFFVLRK